MEPRELLDSLVAVAEEAGIRIRVAPRSSLAEGEIPPRSGLCRIRGEAWLLLVATDSLEERIDATADALRRTAGPFLAERWLPPAVRERLERGSR